MLLLYYYVPESHLNKVNMELFNIGLGKYKNYDCCCWIIKGSGQFRPLSGSKPYMGKTDLIEKVTEYKVEITCSTELKEKAIEQLLLNHPYEVPAYGFLQMVE